MSAAPNAQQTAYWNEQAGPTWAAMQSPMDRQLEPLGRRVMAALALQPGERILDVGCGAGATTLALADAVAPGGSVLGVDISTPLLDVARGRSAGRPEVAFLQADAQTHPLEAAGFDAVFSRFGVMFFADPPRAFANLRRALRPGGRLGFVCWRAPAENPAFTLPMASVQHLLPPPQPPEPGAPGPFAFADPQRVRSILDSAGFADAAIAPHDEKIGAGDLDASLEVALKIGVLGGALRERPEMREAVVDAVRAALAAHEGPKGVKLDSATWIVTARNPG
ncbi:methyltransferase domain-containing protein [Phenylobacterium sp.]|uniref:class I SAM-dependent methyltransferase n=1 Tax=Phenylobacterium sp. TaxID=1871053 RepID=UPI00301E097F